MRKHHYIAEPIRIEKNIPMPHRVHRGRPSRYPWRDMGITDSFLFPKDAKLAACRTMAWDAGRKLMRKFVVAETEEGLRCWRIEMPKPRVNIEDQDELDRRSR